MNYKVLYRKYRPNDFTNIVGQEYLKKILINSIKNNKLSHAYIFSGPRGTGKTSTARILSKAVNCMNPHEGNPCGECEACLNSQNSPDIIEMDAASNNGVDEVRNIIDNIKLANTELKYKVYIIDEVHMMTTSAFNALLRTLEDPPQNVIFILATTDIQNVPITILSRCQILNFYPICKDDLLKRLKYVCQSEKIEYEEEALESVAEMSNGGLRDALSYLEQLSALNKTITQSDVLSVFSGVSSDISKKIISLVNNNNIDELVDAFDNFRKKGTNRDNLLNSLMTEFSKKAIELKTKKNSKGTLTFDKCLKIIRELMNLNGPKNKNSDIYTMTLLTLLEECEAKQIEETHEDLTSIESQNLKTAVETKVDIFEEKSVIINNCLASANIEFKKRLENQWRLFVDWLKTNNKKIYGLLIDSQVMAASDKEVILSVKQDSESQLINLNRIEIEECYKKEFGMEVYFVSVSNGEWQKIKLKYINDKKKGIVYTRNDMNTKDKSDNFDNTLDVFSSDKLEVI